MVRCLWVKDWLPRDEEDVLEEGPLYDSDDPETRTRMDDISDVPLLDQDGAEIRFFTEDGRRVYRRDYRELTEVGALFDLPAAARLCEDGVFEDDYDDDDTLEVEVSALPHSTPFDAQQRWTKSGWPSTSSSAWSA